MKGGPRLKRQLCRIAATGYRRLIRIRCSAFYKRVFGRPESCLLVVIFALIAGAACAQERGTLSANLGYQLQNDSNLFRLPAGEYPVIDGVTRDRNDTSQTGEVGVQLAHTWGRQHVTLDVTTAHTHYSEFDYLDYTATDYDAAWDWGIGKRWLGILSASQTQAERSFADFFSTVRSINTYRSYSASANFRVFPRWTAGAGFTKVSSGYSDIISSIVDYDEKAWDARITFRPASGNELSLVARQADGSYPNRNDVQLVDKEYQQRDVRLEGRYALTARSTITGYLGLARRTYPRTSFRNYSGPIGRLAYDWAFTQKLQLHLQLRRELGAREDLTDTYVVTTAEALRLDWQLTTRVSASIWGEEQSRDYKGDPGFGFALDGQKDDQLVYGAGLTYTPIRKVDVSLAYQRDARTRNTGFGKFDNSTVRLQAHLHY